MTGEIARVFSGSEAAGLMIRAIAATITRREGTRATPTATVAKKVGNGHKIVRSMKIGVDRLTT